MSFLTKPHGIGRPCAQCFVILITDGEQPTGVADPVDAANVLRARNCIVFVVPIGSSLANSAEIDAIAGSPHNVFSVDDFNELNSRVQEIMQAVCNNSACSK